MARAPRPARRSAEPGHTDRDGPEMILANRRRRDEWLTVRLAELDAGGARGAAPGRRDPLAKVNHA